ncbi:hypothetical protein RIR_e42753_A0A2N0P8N8_9GLOM [Rhizophagus irregularis DAOM 181602=DAOM 197198]|nr:hypothetical protein RIR_e42753_A0A2N0P8N8_9GLOM [Rhizophagus irregularis DAOM 181602=DAOM 197198]
MLFLIFTTIYNKNDNENDTNEVNNNDKSDSDSPLKDIYSSILDQHPLNISTPDFYIT